MKYKSLNCENMFNKQLVNFVQDKRTKEYINTIPEDTMIVDDNIDVINILSEYKHITPVWINRKSRDKHEKVKTIFELKELLIS